MKDWRPRPTATLLVAGIALTFAIAGTSIAADPVAKLSKTKVRAIANQQIDKRAPGLSVGNATTADSARSATNTDNLDGLDSAAFMRSTGCGRGRVLGSARFDPAAMVPAASGYSSAGVTNAENCSGGSVEAHRLAVGEYRIRFNGINSVVAVCSVLTDGDTLATATTVAASVIGPGHWHMNLVHWGVNTGLDTKFACVVV